MLKIKQLLVIIFAVVVLLVCGYLVYRAATMTRTYTVQMTFKTMPADDKEMANWMATQPQVTRSKVSRDGNTLIVVFVTPVTAADPEPAIKDAANKMGYVGWQSTNINVEKSPLLPW